MMFRTLLITNRLTEIFSIVNRSALFEKKKRKEISQQIINSLTVWPLLYNNYCQISFRYRTYLKNQENKNLIVVPINNLVFSCSRITPSWRKLSSCYTYVLTGCTSCFYGDNLMKIKKKYIYINSIFILWGRVTRLCWPRFYNCARQNIAVFGFYIILLTICCIICSGCRY